MSVQIEGACEQCQDCEALPEGCQGPLHGPEDEVMPSWPRVQGLVQAIAQETCIPIQLQKFHLLAGDQAEISIHVTVLVARLTA